MGSKTYTANASWVCPPEVTEVLVQAWGGGGGGGQSALNDQVGQGGGGGGAYAASSGISVTPGSAYAVTVGAGGGTQANGGSSSFASSVIAAGGSGASTRDGATGGQASASTGTVRYSGGNGGTSNTGNSGGSGGGSSAGTASDGANGGNATSAGGALGGVAPTGGADGGDGGSTGQTGFAGDVPGGGGGGAGNNNATTNGGSGGRGQVIVSWTDVNGWWNLNGGIDFANIMEYIITPANGQGYGGGSLTGSWTLAFRTQWNGNNGQYAFDSGSGRITIGRNDAQFANGMNIGGTFINNNILSTSDSTYFLTSNGSTVRAYRNNTQIGSNISSAVDIGGTTRWRAYFDNSTLFQWSTPISRAVVYNIELDSTQRQQLHNAMMDIVSTSIPVITSHYRRMRSQ